MYYIEKEKENSKIFLLNFKICGDRFDDKEYSMVKSLWSDQNMIDEIYSIIDHILKGFGVANNIRFIVISDFLFSMISFNLYDPLVLLINISRGVYIGKIRSRAAINTIFGVDYETYIHIHKKLLIGLRVRGILEKSSIRCKKKVGV